MNQQLQILLDFFQQNENITAEEKESLLKAAKKIKSDLEISEFKLERTEKVKRTTAILLEETIEELEQKRKAVEAQNRELEIETSLEKVRTIAMGMRRPGDLLNICEVMFQELMKLGFDDLRNAMINIHYDDQAYLLNYDYSDSTGKTVSTFNYNVHPIVDHLIYHAKQSSDHFTEMIYEGKDLNEWRKFRKENGEVDDVRLDNVDALYYYFYSIGTGAVGISLFTAANEEQLNVLKRFRNVFDLAYKRYVDITTAETQAKEAQIEAALERVRSRTMAMHQTSELHEVIYTVHKELLNLNLSIDGGSFVVINDDVEPGLRCWGAGGTADTSEEIAVPDFGMPFVKNLIKGIKNGPGFFTEEFSQKEKKKYFKKLFEHKPWSDINDEEKNETLSTSGGYTRSVAVSKHTSIFIINHKGRKFTEADNDILNRFAKVFEQTYSRFLDLQKAEAQAREAKIELALERVRARTMAMQKSDELSDAVYVLFQQFKELGEEPDQATIGVINEDENVIEYWVTMYGKSINKVFKFSIDEPNVTRKIYKAWKENKKSLVIDLSGDALTEFMTYRAGKGGAAINPDEKRRIINVAFFSKGLLNVQSKVERSEESIKLLERFATVFNQTYTRFLDLQKAEAQARESQIQLALERVRSRTMAMQKSDELKEVIQLVYEQFVHLNIYIEHTGFLMDYKERDDLHIWLADRHLVPSEVTIPCFDSIPNNSIKEAKDNGRDAFKYLLDFEEKNKFYRDLFKLIPDVPEETLKYYLNCPGLAGSGVLLENIGLYIENFEGIPYTDEENNTLMRLGKVFQQTYTRFLDLQKAEAQARESQIELGLERVRARAMAMQNSDELKDLISTVFIELTKLDLVLTRCTIMIFEPKTNASTWWMANSEAPTEPTGLHVQNHSLPPYRAYITAWKKQKKNWQYILEGKDKNDWDDFLFVETELSKLPAFVIDGMKAPGRVFFSASFNNFGCLSLASLEPLSNEHSDILLRFAKVFDLTYTRFNDLQKAEAQARESEIQLALERVRARTMAMQKQDDLLGVLDLLVEQLVKLGVNLHVVNFSNGLPAGDWDLWIEVVADANNIFNNYIHFPRIDHPYFRQVEKNIETYRKDGTELYKNCFTKEEKDSWQDYIHTQTIYKDLTPEEIKQSLYETPGYVWSMFILKDTWVSICRFNTIPFSGEEDALLRRFANAFGQTYTRFLDLQKAEAQAKESQIEAALEKVRSSSLAMHKSDDLKDVVAVVLEQFQRLGLELEGGAVHIQTFNEDSKEAIQWSADPLLQIVAPYKIPFNDNPVFADFIKAKHDGQNFFFHKYLFEEKNKWFEWAFVHTDFKNLPNNFKKILLGCESYAHWAAIQKNSAILVNNILGKSLSEDQIDILKRFSIVFEQSYIRFLDLQKAEAQAREAQIETGLEKVRSRTLAMQKSDELADTSIVIFEQLINLGIEPNRLFIGIIKDETGNIEAWATNEDGTRIGDHFTLSIDRNESVKKMYEGWKHKKTSITIDMQGKELQNYFHYLANEMKIPFKGGLTQKRRVQTIAYFSQGLIGMASPDEQPQATTQLLERFAAVFNLTYTRFSDLKIAEAHAIQAEEDLIKLQTEKRRAEEALNNLQATQKQLVQAEKMASLGELTAGIAHEIQNPLNFVNNFSEVNSELADELKSELATGNWQLANELASDIKENSEKINHHGKRAGDIVKGMLQHSRASTGTKEPTDINALADEYFRLAYHGLRAKDKSFNATMKTNLDETLQKINVIPQDFGRVLLNLFNNAFYAVKEKQTTDYGRPAMESKYQPTVSVTTKKFENSVVLIVSDNGNGIPQNIVDKIFQPFFTTKPTGSGTGLGLSLSYDIVKAHGGEIKVETKEEEGSTFIITLPINTAK